MTRKDMRPTISQLPSHGGDEIGSCERAREPNAIEQAHAINEQLGRVTGIRREHVSLDARHAEPEPLVEPKQPDVRGGGRDLDRARSTPPRVFDSGLDEPAAERTAPLRRRDGSRSLPSTCRPSG